MSSPYLPEPAQSGGLRPSDRRRAALVVRQAEVEIFSHSVNTEVRLAKAQNNAEAAGEATRCCLNEELFVLEYGLHRAGSNPAAQALALRHAHGLANRNEIRLYRDGF